MKNTPAVSVVMPVYNARAYVAEAIGSILSQTFRDFEFIIIDDGSTDRSAEIILAYDDPRIRYMKNESNLHLSGSLNRALDRAKGRYIARMDADDIALPHRLQTQYDFMQAHPQIDICGSWVEAFGETDGVWERPAGHDAIKAYMLFSNPMMHPTIFAKAAFFESFRYDERFDKSEDYALWIDAIRSKTFANIPKVLLRYRTHRSQVSRTQMHDQLTNSVALKRIMLKRLGCAGNEEEIRLLMLLGYRGDRTVCKIEALDRFLREMVLCNRRTGYVPETVLTDCIGKFRWIRLNTQTFRGLPLLWYAYKSRLMRRLDISFADHVKFVIKCLLKYRSK